MVIASSSSSSSAAATAAITSTDETSNAVELQLSSCPCSERKKSHRRSNSLQAPVIYIELDQPTCSSSKSKSDEHYSSCKQSQEHDSAIYSPSRHQESLDHKNDCENSPCDEEKRTLDDLHESKEPTPTSLKSTKTKRRTRQHRHTSSCVTDWLGPQDDDEDVDGHVGRLSSLSKFLAKNNLRKTQPSDDSSDSDSVTPDFAPSDFQNVHWTRTLQRHMTAPNVSVALLAIATALTHPLLFFVGALTAGAGYYYHDNSCLDSDKKRQDEPDYKATMTTNATGNQWLCWTSTPTETSSTTQTTLVADEPATTLALKGDESSPTSQTSIHAVETQTLSDQDWLTKHYPPLNIPMICNEGGERFVGLNAFEFFNVFYADDAPYNFIECQKKRGDIDICYGAWKDVSNATNPSVSLYPIVAQHDDHQKSTSDQDNTPTIETMQERIISFKAKTNSLLGPPYASTKKTQRYLVLSKRLAVLDSLTTFADIPFHDRFCVMERWVIRAEKEDLETPPVNDHEEDVSQPHPYHQQQHRYTCSVKASCDVVFLQSCPFEYQIRRQASSTLVEVSQAWCSMAQEALQLAEQAKSDRLLRLDVEQDLTLDCESESASDNASAPSNSEYGIEVDYVPQAQVVQGTITPMGRFSKSRRWPIGSTQGSKHSPSPEALVS
jgi:hypothetical protein